MAVLTRVDVLWEDGAQTPRVAQATIEDRSRTGMCLRIHTAIRPGSQLTVKSHREQVSGVAVHCLADNGTYLLGVELDIFADADPQ